MPIPLRKLPRKSGPKWSSKIIIAIVVGAITVISLAVFSLGNSRENSAHASTTMPNQRRFKATRPIVVDRQTGQSRMPTQEEVDSAISSLSVLVNRPESLPQSATASGAVSVDLEGGFAGVMLGRASAEGTLETKCVFTFAEGIEFLGLVEDNSSE